MYATVKENAALAFDGLFGRRYGFFDLLEETGGLARNFDKVIVLDGMRRNIDIAGIPGVRKAA